MLQTVLIGLVMFAACGFAIILMVRLQATQKRLVELHDELSRNNRRMNQQRANLEQMVVEKEIRESEDV